MVESEPRCGRCRWWDATRAATVGALGTDGAEESARTGTSVYINPPGVVGRGAVNGGRRMEARLAGSSAGHPPARKLVIFREGWPLNYISTRLLHLSTLCGETVHVEL